MLARVVILAALCGVAQPCLAETLAPEAVRAFVADKHFDFTCFDGTSGGGWIFGDGSVVGTIQIRGTGEPRYVMLPTGTLRVRGEHYCATHPRLFFEPCFDVVRTSAQSFRGSLLGLASLSCEFTRHDDRPVMTRRSVRLRSSQPMQITPSFSRVRGAD
jgi:hypothetical protein